MANSRGLVAGGVLAGAAILAAVGLAQADDGDDGSPLPPPRGPSDADTENPTVLDQRAEQETAWIHATFDSHRAGAWEAMNPQVAFQGSAKLRNQQYVFPEVRQLALAAANDLDANGYEIQAILQAGGMG